MNLIDADAVMDNDMIAILSRRGIWRLTLYLLAIGMILLVSSIIATQISWPARAPSPASRIRFELDYASMEFFEDICSYHLNRPLQIEEIEEIARGFLRARPYLPPLEEIAVVPIIVDGSLRDVIFRWLGENGQYDRIGGDDISGDNPRSATSYAVDPPDVLLRSLQVTSVLGVILMFLCHLATITSIQHGLLSLGCVGFGLVWIGVEYLYIDWGTIAGIDSRGYRAVYYGIFIVLISVFGIATALKRKIPWQAVRTSARDLTLPPHPLDGS